MEAKKYEELTIEELVDECKAKDEVIKASKLAYDEFVKSSLEENAALRKRVEITKDSKGFPTVEVKGGLFEIIVAEPTIKIGGVFKKIKSVELAENQELCEQLVAKGVSFFKRKN
jgi:hypothetical protein